MPLIVRSAASHAGALCIDGAHIWGDERPFARWASCALLQNCRWRWWKSQAIPASWAGQWYNQWKDSRLVSAEIAHFVLHPLHCDLSRWCWQWIIPVIYDLDDPCTTMRTCLAFQVAYCEYQMDMSWSALWSAPSLVVSCHKQVSQVSCLRRCRWMLKLLIHLSWAHNCVVLSFCSR